MTKTITHSAHDLRAAFRYDSDTGDLYQIKSTGGKFAGSLAGWLCVNGYRYVSLNKRKYLAHRVIWCIVHGAWPTKDVDHINGERADNRIANLRLATRSQNLANQKISKRSSGFKGVSWHKRAQKWMAYIGSPHGAAGREYLGLFEIQEEAHAAYMRAAKSRYGEFARAA